jgi:hypothetical protein
MLRRPISKAAERVLSYLDEMLDETDYYVEVYINGRERGYAVWSYTTRRKVAFAEFRNSDGIVIYAGLEGSTGGDFAWDTNVPSEEVYQSKAFFGYSEAGKAAEAIREYLEQGVKPTTASN